MSCSLYWKSSDLLTVTSATQSLSKDIGSTSNFLCLFGLTQIYQTLTPLLIYFFSKKYIFSLILTSMFFCSETSFTGSAASLDSQSGLLSIYLFFLKRERTEYVEAFVAGTITYYMYEEVVAFFFFVYP